MSHVFISYVRENKADVERLAIALREHGISVWIDRNNIAAGVRWQKAIVDGIKNGAYFIACFSRELAARGETYMLEELNVALDRLRSMPSDRIWLIPLMLNETEIPSIPISRREDINDIQHIRMFEDWEAGITDILKIVDPKYCRVMHLASLVVDHPPERLHAVKELACMGSAVSPALSALRTALRDTDREVCTLAAKAIGNLKASGASAIPELINCLKADAASTPMDRYVTLDFFSDFPWKMQDVPDKFAREVSFALTAIGNAAVPSLIELLKLTENHGAREEPEDSDLYDVGDPVLNWVNDVDSLHMQMCFSRTFETKVKLRAIAIITLANMANDAAAAAPALIAALSDTSGAICELALRAIRRLGDSAIPDLMQALVYTNDEIRFHVILLLGKTGLAANCATPHFERLIHDKNTEVRRAAEWALARINPLPRKDFS